MADREASSAASARLRRKVSAVQERATSHEALAHGVLDLLIEELGLVGAIWCSTDPVTLLPTALFLRGPIATFTGANPKPFFHRDNDREAPMSVAQVARAPGGAKKMSDLGNGAWRGMDLILKLVGFSDEMRFVLTDVGVVWGVITMAVRRREFTEPELAMMGSLGPRLGHALRLQFLRRAAERPSVMDGRPGVITVGPTGEVEHTTEAAAALLPLTDGRGPFWLPMLRESLATSGQPVSIMTSDGPVTLHGTAMGERIVVIVERTRPLQLAESLVAAHGFTPRERQVVQGVCSGLSTREIAFSLDIADWTVQDHLKSTFGKVGVNSRKRLVASLLRTHAMPLQQRGAEPSPYGWFFETGESAGGLG